MHKRPMDLGSWGPLLTEWFVVGAKRRDSYTNIWSGIETMREVCAYATMSLVSDFFVGGYTQ